MEIDIHQNIQWFAACKTDDVPADGGVCVKYKEHQIALFRFERRNEWFACQNMCPHKQQMAISRGMLGSLKDEPKVACPFHKKTFSLIDGRCLNSDEAFMISTYPIKVENNLVYINVSAIENTNNNYWPVEPAIGKA